MTFPAGPIGPDAAPGKRPKPPKKRVAEQVPSYVSLAELAAAVFDVRAALRDPGISAEERESVQRLRNDTRHSWELHHGAILEDYFGDALSIGVVLTYNGDLQLAYRAGEVAGVDTRLAECLSRVEFLESRARVLLPVKRDHIPFDRQRRAIVGTQLYSVARYVLGFVDYGYWLDGQIDDACRQELDPPHADTATDGAAPNGQHRGAGSAARRKNGREAERERLVKRKEELICSAVQVATKRLDAAEEALHHETHAKATRTYVGSMTIGLLFIIAAVSVVAHFMHSSKVDAVSLAFAISAGAIGAGISVLTRLVSGSLRVDPAASPGALTISGLSRVIVGGIFGAVVFIFASAGLVSLPKGTTGTSPESGAPTTYLWIAFGFLAGFSERWVQDLLGSVETPKGGQSQDSSTRRSGSTAKS